VKLAKREKYFVTIAACAIALFFIVQYPIMPFFAKRDRLQKGIKLKEAGLAEMVKLSAEYKSLQEGSQSMEQLIARREKESMVEMKLEGITLAQLAGYLHRVELPQKAIIIKRISVKENAREAGSLEAVVQALTYE
jgi:hypothetical protein